MTQHKSASAQRGQSTLELVWLVVAIVTIIVAMQTILRRGVGGRYRSSIDQLSQQHFAAPKTMAAGGDFEPYALGSRSHEPRSDTTTTTGASDSVVGEHTYTVDATTGKVTDNPIITSGALTREAINVGSDSEIIPEKDLAKDLN